MMGNENNKITQNDSLPIYLFHQGTNFRAYDFLGVHREEDDGKIKYYFRVWAPNAKNVSLCSSFTDWEDGLSMQRVNKEGIWELLIESDKPLEGEFYKYRSLPRRLCPLLPRVRRDGLHFIRQVFLGFLLYRWGILLSLLRDEL